MKYLVFDGVGVQVIGGREADEQPEAMPITATFDYMPGDILYGMRFYVCQVGDRWLLVDENGTRFANFD